MAKRTQDLERMANLFVNSIHKNAGLIKVPEPLLQKVGDFICACYATALSHEMRGLIISSRKRNNDIARLKPMVEEWENNYKFVPGIVLDRNTYELSWLTRTNFPTIPKFNTDKISWGMDSISMDTDKKSLEFKVSKNESGDYNCSVYIDMPQSGGIKASTRDESATYLTSEELFDFLNKHIDAIRNAYSVLSTIVEDHLDPTDSEYLKNMTVTYNVLAQQAQKTKVPPHYNKNFAISKEELPYNVHLPAGMDRLIFGVSFVGDQASKEAIYNRESWRGLWQENVALKKDGFIGNLTVAEDLSNYKYEVDFKDIETTMNRLRETTRHELQHLVQSFLAYGTGKSTAGGPNNKPTDSEYDSYGTYKQDFMRKQPHRLRDIEFYTNLTDSVQYFNQSKRHIPTQLHKLYAALWVGQIQPEQFLEKADQKNYQGETNSGAWDQALRAAISAFRSLSLFPDLKTGQPKNYPKAVREFVKAINLF